MPTATSVNLTPSNTQGMLSTTKKFISSNKLFTVLSVAAFFAFAYIWSDMFFLSEKGIIAGSANLWADWVVHLSYTNAYLEWPFTKAFTESPLLFGDSFQYPPLPNLLNALLVKLGLPITVAMSLTSFIANLATFFLLILLFNRLGFSWLLAFVGSTLLFLNGGLGFLHLLSGSESKLATNMAAEGINIQNFFLSEFIPQKAISTAAPFLLLYVLILHRALSADLTNPSHQLSLKDKAISIALLTFFSSCVLLSSLHTFICLVVVSAVYGSFYINRLPFLATLAFAGALVNGFLYFSYYAQNDTSGFISWNPMGIQADTNLGAVAYFVWNYGAFLLAVGVGLIWLKAYRYPLAIAGIVIFLIAHLFQFQPWIWDNTKLITWGYCFMSVAVLLVLKKLSEAGWRQTTRDILVLSLITSGALDVWLTVKPDAPEYTLFTTDEIQLAEEFKAISSVDDVVITYANHSNWIHALAGRQVFNAYSGWLWSYGKDTAAIEKQRDELVLTYAENSSSRAGSFPETELSRIQYIVADRSKIPNARLRKTISGLSTVIENNRYSIKRLPEY